MTEQEKKNKAVKSEVIELMKIKNRLQGQEANLAIKKAINSIEEAVKNLNSYMAGIPLREEIHVTEKKRVEEAICSRCNKIIELTDQNCHSVFSREHGQTENYFFCKSCQKMILYEKK
jgi:hypothetical protein